MNFGIAKKLSINSAYGMFGNSKPDLNHWSSTTRQVYVIADMETSHIENCVTRIKKNPGWRQEYLPVFERELKRRESKLYKALK